MSAETDLVAVLNAATQLTNVVGSRIYPDIAPVDVQTPCVAFERVDTEYVISISGNRLAERASLEITCMADRRAEAEQIADVITPVIYSQRFIPTGRRAEFDDAAGVWSAVLSIDYWQT